MRSRPIIWLLISLLLLAGGVYFWQSRSPSPTTTDTVPPVAAASAVRPLPASPNPSIVSAATAPAFLSGQSASVSAPKTNRLAYRLRNTPKTAGQLVQDDHAILLENALIDTRQALGFAIPQHLQAAADPGSYIVQAHGPVNDAFRAALTAAGGTIISYIPNNAYLVLLSAEGASQLSVGGIARAVLPNEPVYKFKSGLLQLALEQKPLPPDVTLNVMIFADRRAQVIRELQQSGAVVLNETPSAFIGPVFTIRPGENWTALAQLPGVAVVERVYPRVAANDLSRVRVGVAEDSTNSLNYLSLTGAGVLVSVNDTGVDPAHPDLTGRVLADFPSSLVDDNGHGTFVAGAIAGSGAVSETVSNAQGSLNPGVLGQYRGKAPAARVFSQSLSLGSGAVSDATLQETAAATNALISNNSWSYGTDNTYSIGAASYDAAVRDALPRRTGSQPVLYVFAAGNDGQGEDSGLGGETETILSPATAKNVITVGALEQPRDITNAVVINCVTTNINGTNVTICDTNYPWEGMTSSGSQVAFFSSRGNVGIDVEGEFGRFKPDLVAPGTFVVSTRSSTWDEEAYYNSTSHLRNTIKNQIAYTNSLNDHSLFIPANAVGFTIQLLPNADSPLPFPNLPIYVRRDGLPDPPATYDFVRDNSVSVPPDGGGIGTSFQQNWFYSIGNTTTQNVSFTIVTDVIVTNEFGNYFEVLSNLNNSISGTNPSAPQYYRYESGTSMAAADVSGTLALMQEFFQQTFGVTNSPALMKALLINGARSVGSLYDFEVQNTKNFQGWGVPKLNNSLPPGITNAFSHGGGASMQLFDQSPATALATGQRQTRLLTINAGGTNVPLRITLVWTDPPGNPVAGVKLVNDLDLVVTNLVTGEVFFGNNIPASSTFTIPWASNSPPTFDSINNVENVYLSPALGANYSVTVVGHRVNVNAVTAQTNNVVQDYALVISSGDGQIIDALTLTEQPVVAVNVPYVTPVTNSLAGNTTVTGSILLGQHVGANTPLLGTTNGMTNQWHFYTVTNTENYTNAAFITFLPPELSVPRIAVRDGEPQNGTLLDADIDLYVSTDPGLLTLNPAIIAAADKSRNRGGTEFVAYSNAAPGAVYYIGVKSEDQMAAEYAFFGGFSLDPFSSTDANGNVLVNGFPIPSVIPDGTPDRPGGAITFGLALQPITVRSLIVTNSIYLQNAGDIVSTLTHARKFAVLSNHRVLPPGLNTYVYEDNDEQNLQRTDGPGSLRDFVGDNGIGVWLLSTVDNSLSQTGSVTRLKLLLSPTINSTNGESIFNIEPGRFVYTVVDVPVGATNLSICIANDSVVPAPVELYVRRDDFPSRVTYDYFKLINPPFECLTISSFDIPPLQPGRYYLGVYNPSGTAQTIRLKTVITLDPNGVVPNNWVSIGNQPFRDDAVTDSIITVTNDALIQQVEVGVRIAHPRVSDLAVTLISPQGTRVLLTQNRGGTSTEGLGTTVAITNVAPASATGGPTAVTNVIDTGATSGTLTIDYDFFEVPDQMTVYYEGALLRDTGLINGAGQFTVKYGPGLSTFVTIVMNEFGNPISSTAWKYTASSVTYYNINLVFTENTNLTTTPIKFAPPPMNALPPGPTLPISDFEPPQLTGDFAAPALVDGWNVVSTNPVAVVAGVPPLTVGAQSLALQTGELWRPNLPTVAGSKYQLGYGYRRAGTLDGIVSWWPGQSNTTDIVDGNPGALFGGVTYGVGQVGAAFNFDGINGQIVVANAANLNFGSNQNFSIEAWIQPQRVSTFQDVMNIVDKRNAPDRTHGIGYEFALQGGRVFFRLSDSLADTGVAFGPAGPDLRDGRFHHVAVTLDRGSTNGGNLYVDGASVLTFDPTVEPGDLTNDQPLLIGAHPTPLVFAQFKGTIDELAIYNAGLTAGEIQQIYAAGAAGKCGMLTPPAVCGTALGAQIYLPGQLTNTFLGTTNWQLGGLIFTALSNNTAVGLAPVVANLASGVLLDTFTLIEFPKPRYVLAEESLEVLKGENAAGDWTLELWDSRVGATNQVSLMSWELQFIFQNPAPLSTSPFVITQPATNIASASATLNATVNPNRSVTTVYFEYGPTTNYGFFSTSNDLTANLNLTQWVGIGVTNLTPATLYHFRAVGSNSFATIYGDDLTFTTLGIPTQPFASTLPATLATGAGAQLNGMATPNGAPATAWFEWGTGPGYGLATPPVNLGNSFNVIFVTNQISGLITNLPYHFRLVVSNALGVAYGFDQIFDQANVVAWGATYFGQATVPPALTNLVTSIAAGYDTSLAVNNDGTMVAWGDNTFGQTNVPPGLGNAVAAAGSDRSSAALRSDRTVLVWGSNQFRQTNAPPDLTNAVALSSGGGHNLALREDGNVVAWGFNGLGQTNVPASLSNVVAIAAGELHSLALKNDGTVVAWGYNDDGATNVPSGLTNVVAIAAGYHNLALQGDGTVVSWGYNGTGQANVPAGLSNVIAVSAGSFHSLALKNDGSLVTWGDNSSLQTSVPPGLSNVVAIAGGGLHSLALSSLFGLNQTNTSPFWLTNPPSPIRMEEMTILVVTNTASDTNVPTQTLSYSLLTGPLWASINAQGHITLSPQLGDGPSTNTITTRVVDNGYPALSATNQFDVIVGVPDLSTNVVISILYTNSAGTNGFLLTWFAPSNQLFQVQWTDSLAPVNWQTFPNPPVVGYNPNFPASLTTAQFNFFDDGSQTGGRFGPTRSYRVIPVSARPPIVITDTTVTSTNFCLTWNSVPGVDYRVEGLTNLSSTNWVIASPTVSASGNSTTWCVPLPSPFQFFRVQEGPGVTNTPIVIIDTTVTSTNFCLTWTSLPGVIYRVEGLTNLNSTNWVIASPTVFASWTSTTWCVPLPSPFQFFRVQEGPGVTNTPIVITDTTVTSTNFCLTWTSLPGVIYRVEGLTNLSSTNWVITSPTVSASGSSTTWCVPLPSPFQFFRVQEGPGVTNTPIVITDTTVTSTNFCLTWTSLPGVIYRVEGLTNLSSTNWVIASPTVSASGSSTTWCVPLPSPFQFFRVQEGPGVTSPPSVPPQIQSLTYGTNGVTLRWNGPNLAQYNVQWAPSLAPLAWNSFTNLITSPTGLFQFLDDGSQTSGLGGARYYRLLRLP